jgi:glycosyltransferase involved in cell wall biosynthesis
MAFQFPERHFSSPRPAALTTNSNDGALSKDKVRVALVGTFAPRKCGIATFTTDAFEQLATYEPDVEVDVYALDRAGSGLVYPPACQLIDVDSARAYQEAARRINQSGADCVWIQHEFGIFGANEGEAVVQFVDRIHLPMIFTFHTVLTDPSPLQRAIIEHLVSRAARIMVMSQHGRRLLRESYGAHADAIEVIPHGAPDRPFGRQELFKAGLGLSGCNVLTTFGLLGPGKGLEHAIEAMPAIVARHPDTVYRIVGATHPDLVAVEGEAYRCRLQALARNLRIEANVEWDNRFLDTPELLDQLEACDIYVTPYPNLQQSTSGTLSYAVALGKAVVSTPYVHACELLASDVGILIEPNSSAALASAIVGLLDDRQKLLAVQQRAYAIGRKTIWPEFARAIAMLARSSAMLARKAAQAPMGDKVHAVAGPHGGMRDRPFVPSALVASGA